MTKAVPWLSRPIFITRTFRDMHAERDYLRHRVFPELEERLAAKRGVRVCCATTVAVWQCAIWSTSGYRSG